jgi:hypothetical protein
MKPEQAALISNPQAFVAPTLSHIMFAVDGNLWSPVTVPTKIRSISCGEIPLFLQIPSTILAPISDAASPSAHRWYQPSFRGQH